MMIAMGSSSLCAATQALVSLGVFSLRTQWPSAFCSRPPPLQTSDLTSRESIGASCKGSLHGGNKFVPSKEVARLCEAADQKATDLPIRRVGSTLVGLEERESIAQGLAGPRPEDLRGTSSGILLSSSAFNAVSRGGERDRAVAFKDRVWCSS